MTRQTSDLRPAKAERAKVALRGTVQGVGFRPFVYRLATERSLAGWVLNTTEGLFLEVEGPAEAVADFLLRLEREKPPLSSIQSIEITILDRAGYEGFEIRFSEAHGSRRVPILPDIATCRDCLDEIFDPANRRYRYPFTNCTNCGPRFSIIESLPYDRGNTSMRRFPMCPDCAREYRAPADRRFHAQPTACPACGPQLELWDAGRRVLARRDEAIMEAACAIRSGRIVAVKGIGGFQLLADATNEEAVRLLRTRKQREEKPFALMVPDLSRASGMCAISASERRLLQAPEAPIVLLDRRPRVAADERLSVASNVAPDNPFLGLMLPYSPLHHLLMRELQIPVVATSGNLANEPICIDENEAADRLGQIADRFLVHDRAIVRPLDDSIARVILGREQVLRRARGYAPLPVRLRRTLPPILALGAHLKNSVALAVGSDVFLSQHIGDLETEPACSAFRRVAADLPGLYGQVPEIAAFDLHPEYLSTRFGLEMAARPVPVQHHYAHALACMAENEIDPPALGVTWDGTGLGEDGTIWGGEFLVVDEFHFRRAAHLRPFRLPGGDEAIRQPRRSALGALFEMFGEKLFSREHAALLRHFTRPERTLLRQMLLRGINSPITTSAGRLFDAAASLAGLRQRTNFEGQSAMELEFSIEREVNESYPFALGRGEPMVVDWAPTLLALLEDASGGTPPGVISARFHNAMAEIILAVARQIGELRLVLSGGCFQNRYLTERAVHLLRRDGFLPSWHQRIPPNDGGIAVGQVLAAERTGSRT